MKISIVCSSADHPVNDYIVTWMNENKANHTIQLVRKIDEVESGDILFLISCSEIVKKQHRDKFKKTLVLHASDLPVGRGWSPHIWDILNGAEKITLTVLEAEDKVDTGNIWKKEIIQIPRTDLFDEINAKLFQAEMRLMSFAIKNFEGMVPSPQENTEATYHPKRTPADSEIDINKPLSTQFNLLRVADPNRFPAFFTYEGVRYTLRVEKL